MISLRQYIQEQKNKELKSDIKEPNGFVILKPGFLEHEQSWLNMIESDGWQIIRKRTTILSYDQCKELYKIHTSKRFYNDLCEYMSSADCICAICYKMCDDPIGDMKKLKDKVRDIWGVDDMKNCMHSSDSLKNVEREATICFNDAYDVNNVNEVLKINKNSKYKECCPRTKKELQDILIDTVRKHNSLKGDECIINGDVLDLNFIDTSKITDMRELFNVSYTYKDGGNNASLASSIINIDIMEWDISNVESFAYMFKDCDALESIGYNGPTGRGFDKCPDAIQLRGQIQDMFKDTLLRYNETPKWTR